MKEKLKNFKQSEAYEVLKDQSAMIIFIATLIGSVVTLITKINTYLYDLGRFKAYDIPIELINTESFSFYDVVKIFVSISCYVGGILAAYCMLMMAKSGITLMIINYKLGNNKRLFNIIGRIIFLILSLSIIILSVDTLMICILVPRSKKMVIIAIILLVSLQFMYGISLTRETDKKIKSETVKDSEIKENCILNKKMKKLTEDEIIKLDNEANKVEKSIKYPAFVVPVVLIFFFSSAMGISNYYSGKASARDTEETYQIVVLNESEYVVLDKSGEKYILAKRIPNEEKGVLVINTNEQKIVSINEFEYMVKKFDKVILEKKQISNK